VTNVAPAIRTAHNGLFGWTVVLGARATKSRGPEIGNMRHAGKRTCKSKPTSNRNLITFSISGPEQNGCKRSHAMEDRRKPLHEFSMSSSARGSSRALLTGLQRRSDLSEVRRTGSIQNTRMFVFRNIRVENHSRRIATVHHRSVSFFSQIETSKMTARRLDKDAGAVDRFVVGSSHEGVKFHMNATAITSTGDRTETRKVLVGSDTFD
jgi:hypothetical protein